MAELDVAALLRDVEGASLEVDDGLAVVTVPAGSWHDAAEAARDRLGLTFFDLLGVAQEGTALVAHCHLARLGDGPAQRLMLRAHVPDGVRLISLADLYAGAAWHEREAAEMFGLGFTDAAGRPLELAPLLVPPGMTTPLRKEVPLVAREERPWPGAKEPT